MDQNTILQNILGLLAVMTPVCMWAWSNHITARKDREVYQQKLDEKQDTKYDTILTLLSDLRIDMVKFRADLDNVKLRTDSLHDLAERVTRLERVVDVLTQQQQKK